MRRKLICCPMSILSPDVACLCPGALQTLISTLPLDNGLFHPAAEVHTRPIAPTPRRDSGTHNHVTLTPKHPCPSFIAQSRLKI